jgi:hypothetical protein
MDTLVLSHRCVGVCRGFCFAEMMVRFSIQFFHSFKKQKNILTFNNKISVLVCSLHDAFYLVVCVRSECLRPTTQNKLARSLHPNRHSGTT